MQNLQRIDKNEPHSTRRRQALIGRTFRWVQRGFALFGAAVLLYVLTLDVSIVVSPSMAPTLQGTGIDDGDHVVTEKVSKWFRRPRRWEVITFVRDDGVQIMKRVAGLPGEEVQLSKDRHLMIDGRLVEVPAHLNQKYLRYGNLFAGEPISCGEGFYVLGDDLKDSDDSRFNGPVPGDRVVGNARLIVWPVSRFGFVR